MGRRPKHDHPYWTTTRYKTKCDACGAPIAKGERALYYPVARKSLCDSANCGWVDDPGGNP